MPAAGSFGWQLSFVATATRKAILAFKSRRPITKDTKMGAILFWLGIAVYVAAFPFAWIRVMRRARGLAQSNASLSEELAETHAALASEKMWRLATNILDEQIVASSNEGEPAAANRRLLSSEDTRPDSAEAKIIRPHFGRPAESRQPRSLNQFRENR